MPRLMARSSSPPVSTSSPALAHHDRGAGVLAHREHAAGRDVGVLQQVEGDEAVVGRRLGIVEDPAQLLQVGGPQPVGDVAERGAGEQRERLGLHLEEGAPGRLARWRTPSVVRSRYGVSSGPRGRSSVKARSVTVIEPAP